MTGPGRPRCAAAADSSPQITAMLRAAEMTGLSDRQLSSAAPLPGPQFRSLVHWVSSPMVTKVGKGCRPARTGASRPRKECDATSVSKTTARAGGSGKVRVA